MTIDHAKSWEGHNSRTATYKGDQTLKSKVEFKDLISWSEHSTYVRLGKG
jgi:hypothetical protein